MSSAMFVGGPRDGQLWQFPGNEPPQTVVVPELSDPPPGRWDPDLGGFVVDAPALAMQSVRYTQRTYRRCPNPAGSPLWLMQYEESTGE